MRTLKTASVLVGGTVLAVLAAPCLAQVAEQVEGQGPPVFPVEIAAPLPVPVEGTVAVEEPVEVTGTVDANVTNTPTVHVGNPVTLVDPRTPFQAHHSSGFYGADDSIWRADSEAVPEGMRLVLNHVSTSYVTSSETLGIAELWHCNLYVLPEPGANHWDFVMIHPFPTSTVVEPREGIYPQLHTAGSSQVLMFAEAGQAIAIRCPIPDDNNISSTGALGISGYLVPVE